MEQVKAAALKSEIEKETHSKTELENICMNEVKAAALKSVTGRKGKA